MTKGKNYTRRHIIGTMAAAAVATTAVAEATMPAEATVGAFGESASPQVQVARVLRYSFGWNSARRGILYLYLENGREPATINIQTPEELTAYLTILKEPAVFYDSQGWVYTGTQNPR
jgi:hypothetical protein